MATVISFACLAMYTHLRLMRCLKCNVSAVRISNPLMVLAWPATSSRTVMVASFRGPICVKSLCKHYCRLLQRPLKTRSPPNVLRAREGPPQ